MSDPAAAKKGQRSPRRVPADRILVIGQSGQIAKALAHRRTELELIFCGRPNIDLADHGSLARAMAEVAPVVVVNAAAYTAVDKAESEPELAHTLNAEGPGVLARLCADAGVPLFHLSTDYVFAGDARAPYRPDAPVAPQCVYGLSKAEGEALIRATLPEHLIFRTAWVYAAEGRNFLNTMLRLAGERDKLTIVDDQHGAPTWANDIANAMVRIIEQVLASPNDARWGTYHLTSRGETTWFGFAREIFSLAAARGLKTPQIVPVGTSDYPAPARRPAYSVLDMASTEETFGIVMPEWRDALRQCMRERLDFQPG